jgi:hypothetical protein
MVGGGGMAKEARCMQGTTNGGVCIMGVYLGLGVKGIKWSVRAV